MSGILGFKKPPLLACRIQVGFYSFSFEDLVSNQSIKLKKQLFIFWLKLATAS